jgi:hypothetical protein
MKPMQAETCTVPEIVCFLAGFTKPETVRFLNPKNRTGKQKDLSEIAGE